MSTAGHLEARPSLNLKVHDGLNQEVEGLRLENELFQQYLARQLIDQVDTHEQFDSRRTRQRRRHPQRLTLEQKCDIANVEHEQIQGNVLEQQKKAEKLINTLRAVLEETAMRIAELKKDAYEFKRDIVVGAENMRTGKTVAEKIMRYTEDKLRQREAVIEKLRLKNASIKIQLQKLEAQLKQKEEMGDVLHYIDFHQLQIENKQYQSSIEERNEELLRLKLCTGKTLQALNNFKHRLNHTISEATRLSRDLALRDEQLSKTEQDTVAVVDRGGCHDHALGCQQVETCESLSTMEYIKQKAREHQLDISWRSWQRKGDLLDVAEITRT